MKRTRRWVALLAASLMVLPALPTVVPAGAKQPKKVQTQEYFGIQGLRTEHYPDDVLKLVPETPPLVFSPRASDRFVYFDLDDDAGGTVFIRLRQAPQGSRPGLERNHCGDAGTFELANSNPVEVVILAGACRNHLFAYSISGSITATFSRKPPSELSGAHTDH